jgi:hypothetical protein
LGAEGEPWPGWPAEGVIARRWRPYFPPGYDSGIRSAPDGSGGVYVSAMIWDQCWAHCGSDPKAIWVSRTTAAGEPAPGWPDHGVEAAPGFEMVRFMVPRIEANGDNGVFLGWHDWERSTRFLTEHTGPLYLQWMGPDGTRHWGDHGLLLADGNLLRSNVTLLGSRAGHRTADSAPTRSTWVRMAGSGGESPVWRSHPPTRCDRRGVKWAMTSRRRWP